MKNNIPITSKTIDTFSYKKAPSKPRCNPKGRQISKSETIATMYQPLPTISFKIVFFFFNTIVRPNLST